MRSGGVALGGRPLCAGHMTDCGMAFGGSCFTVIELIVPKMPDKNFKNELVNFTSRKFHKCQPKRAAIQPDSTQTCRQRMISFDQNGKRKRAQESQEAKSRFSLGFSG